MKKLISVFLLLSLLFACMLGAVGCSTGKDEKKSSKVLGKDDLIFTKNSTGYTVELFSLDIFMKYRDVDSFLLDNADRLEYDALVIPATYNGEPVTAIGDYAFRFCKFESVTLPSSISSVGDYSFANCGAIQTLTLPSSVDSIGQSAFADCTELKRVVIPAEIEKIGERAFYGCSSISEAFYHSTEANWEDNVRVYGSNTSLTDALYFFSAERPIYSGRYWHYDDNGIVLW